MGGLVLFINMLNNVCLIFLIANYHIHILQKVRTPGNHPDKKAINEN